MKTLVSRYYNGKSILTVFILAMIIYTVMLTITLPHLKSIMNGLDVFDMRPMGYSVEEGREILNSLPNSGVEYYRNIQLPLDFIYPGLLAIFGVLSFGYIRKWTKVPAILFVFPIFAGMFDYLENIAIYAMLGGMNSSVVIKTASILSISKSVSTTIFLFALLGLVTWTVAGIIYKKMRSK